MTNATKLRLLDCTLRDGGHVNNWNFGETTIRQVIEGLSHAGIDIIELGLLKNVNSSLDSTIQPSISAFSELVSSTEANQSQYYTVMIRPDWFDAANLEEFSKHSIVKGIRFAFYPADSELAYKQGCMAKEKGYDIFFNAVGVSCYPRGKLITTLNMLNSLEPIGYSIVDTFGAFDVEELEYFYEIFEASISTQAHLGLHLHENRSLAQTLARHFIKIRNPARAVIIDASLLGMGRIPGNLCIEQIIPILSASSDVHSYNLELILKLIKNYIYPIREAFAWGYSPEYMLSALANVNRNYPEYLQERNFPLHEYAKVLEEVRSRQGNDFQFRKGLIDDILSHFLNQSA
jgi:4-hydroxy 2-oxovalerate aldolase